MGFFDFLFGKKAVDYGRVDPNNQQAFYAANTEYGQLYMQGPAAVQTFYAKYGLRDEAHWIAVKTDLMTKWANQPGGAVAMSQAAYANVDAQLAQAQQAAMAMMPPVPPEELAPVEGIDILLYARLVVGREKFAANPQAIAGFMASQGCPDEGRFQRAEAEWKRRMTFGDPNRSAIVASLNARYNMAVGTAQQSMGR